MINPFVSICIATYNRAKFIGETIESILPQLTPEVELLIVDGASTDNTKEIVTGYCNENKHIRYVRLPAKGGVDQDYDAAVGLANGSMCWLFTDDDLLKPNAVSTVLQEVKKGYDLIVVNAEIRNNDLSRNIQDRRLPQQTDAKYLPEDFEKFFIVTAKYLTFIGAVVIRKEIWIGRDRIPYYGTEFIHIGVIFQKVLENSMLVISEPYIVIRYGNAQWEPRRFNIWMFKWPKLIWSFSTVTDNAKSRITTRDPWKSLRTLILCRADGEYTRETFLKYLLQTDQSSMWKVIAFGIALSPRILISGMRYLYAVLK